MIKLAATCALVIFAFGSLSHGFIERSRLEPRHQVLIEAQLLNRCNLSGTVREISVKVTPSTVDQPGGADLRYEIELEILVGVTQVKFDRYRVTVVSNKAEMYDQAAGKWGSYQIESIRSPDRGCVNL